jgi:hypothetical protein
LASFTSAWACLGSTEPPLDSLLKDSDLVIKARVVSYEIDNPVGYEQAARTSVAVDRIYKGQPSGSKVNIHWKNNMGGCSWIRLDPGRYALFFLKRDGDDYTYENMQWGTIPSDSVRSELGDGTADPARLLDSDLRAELQRDAGTDLIGAVRLFAALHPAKLSPPPICRSGKPCDDRREYQKSTDDAELVALFPASDPLLEATAHRALLQIGDLRFFEAALAVAEGAGDTRNFSIPADAVRYARAQIADRVSNVIGDEWVPLLNRFSGTSSSILRRSVVYALRQNHSPSSVPFLLARLDDDDLETLAQATWGLFEITNPGQSSEAWVITPRQPWRGEDINAAAEVVARWKTWWASSSSDQYRQH